jgi:cytoskeletal protein CcmA (bactofilin family)
MTTAMDQDLKIMGEIAQGGGRYRDIAVMGRVRMDSDVTCRSFSCMGEARLEGGLVSERTTILGRTEVAGPVDAGDFTVVGEMDVRAALRARKVKCTGKVRIQDRLDAGKVQVFGELTVQGDCNADEFRSMGAFRIDGLLSVDILKIEAYGPSRVGEIGGGRIEVRRRGSFLGRALGFHWLREALFGARGARFEVQSIEGDDVLLEDTDAKVVRGARVTLGPGCRVDLVEYRDTYRADPGATVGEARRA